MSRSLARHTKAGAAVAAGAAATGLAQIPLSDNAVIIPIQITMILSLAKVFDRSLDEAAAKALLLQTITTMLGKTAARTFTQFVIGWIPGVGNVVNASTAAALTEALGWLVADDFDREKQKECGK